MTGWFTSFNSYVLQKRTGGGGVETKVEMRLAILADCHD